MSHRGVGKTALGAAVCRLIEQAEPAGTRLFVDPVVGDLLGAPVRWMLKLSGMRHLVMGMMEGVYGLQVCRTRYIDDAVVEALSDGMEQLVLLGAGYDTRPYRLPGLERVRIFEVDLPHVQADKMRELRRHRRSTERVTFIPIDFDKQPLQAALAGTAFDSSKRSVIVWEGVTQYISEEAARRTLAFVGAQAPATVLVFTYVLKSVVERRSQIPGADKMMDAIAKRGAPWVFGLEPSGVEALLREFGLCLVADDGGADYERKYLKPLKRELSVSEVERIVQARVGLGT
jgi:methyltransferase (TIGR00027 family)